MIKKEDKYRFEFGKNWENYINKVGSFQITKAMESFERFGIKNKSRKSFLDIGSGSGLFSLAAFKLGFKKIDMNQIGLKKNIFPKRYIKFDVEDIDGRRPNFHRNRKGEKAYDFW